MSNAEEIGLWVAGKPPRLAQKASLWVPLPGQSRSEAVDPIAHSKVRWRGATPDNDLTWGEEISGVPFVEMADWHGVFRPGARILEVGPGYGRLPAAIQELGVEFGDYLGLDLSEQNVAHLRERFAAEPRMQFEVADAESWTSDRRFDVVISSLTFKHIYPTYEKVLRNLGAHLEPGGKAVFDLIEGRRRYFRGETYIRWYTKRQAELLAQRAGLEVVAFDSVRHTPRHLRLLVVCSRPKER
jgi:SAM-dependent methyltransferase